MKLALIGCGGIARGMHMPAIQIFQKEQPDYQVAACCDLDGGSAQRLAEDFGIPAWYTDMNAMLKEVKPDAAICLVSEKVNHLVAGDLLARGIPTLLEKPPGHTPEEFSWLAAEQQRAGTPHMVGFNRRFMPVHRRMLEQIGSSPLRYMDYAMYRVARHENHFETTAIHAVDAVAFLCRSRYAKLSLRYQEMPWHGEAVANYFLEGEMHSGTQVTLRILVSTGEVRERCEAHLDDAVLIASGTRPYDDSDGGLTLLRPGTQPCFLPGKDFDPLGQPQVYNGFLDEHKTFFRCLTTGETPPSQLSDVGQSVEICDGLKQRKTSYLDRPGNS